MEESTSRCIYKSSNLLLQKYFNSRAILGNEAVVLLASFLNMSEKTSNV